MKKFVIGYGTLALALFFGIQSANAQQGFGTNQPSKASAIEMKSSNKGLLIPRVALTSREIFSPVRGESDEDEEKTNSLLVYNTNTAGTAPYNVTPGYYYWTTANKQWNRLFTEEDVVLTEPWYNQATNTQATANTQNIYQTGNVAIGKNAVYTNGISAMLDVAGAVRGGTNQQGVVGANSVAFGNSNEASGTASVALGNSNTASNLQSTVSGGSGNVASGSQSTVSGGLANSASGSQATVSGGYDNEASGLTSTVSGGFGNTASQNYAVVSGGQNNTASGERSTLSGGYGNTASQNYAVVSGGESNQASGSYSTVSGGQGNTAASAFEWVGGRYGTIYTPGSTTTWNVNDRLFNVGRGIATGNRADAFTILKNGKTGVGFDNFEAVTFPQLFQVNGNARFVALPSVAGNLTTDKIVVADGDGVLKTVAVSALATNMDNGTNTTLSGTGTSGDPFEVNVATANGTTLGVVQQAASNPTVNVASGVLSVNTANLATQFDGDITSANTALTVSGGDNAAFTDVTLTLNANSGVQVANNNVQLGGNLQHATTITNNSNPLTIATGGTTTSITGLPVAVPADNSSTMVVLPSGQLKTVRQLPRLFYMPPVIFDTSANGEELTRNIYDDYSKLFTGTTLNMAHGAGGGSMPYTGGLIKSDGAPDIPVYAANQLWYYVIYYDETVFDNVSISATGLLTYDIIGNATDTSYMTIAFSVKE